MDFGVLGPLEVLDHDRSVQLGGPKQRTVLVHLLLRANKLVTAERLIDARRTTRMRSRSSSKRSSRELALRQAADR
jgi:hypothetical protein